VDQAGHHVRGAVSLLGFRRQLLVWLAREVVLLEPPANPPHSVASEAPSGSLAVRHLA